MNHNILVLAVDGLRASALGAYGNTWYETPNLDRFAAESFLAEWCFANAVTLPEVYRALWFAEHPHRAPSDMPSIVRRLAERGYNTRLVTDDQQLTELAGAADFDVIDVVARATERPVEDPADAHAWWLMAAVAESFQPHDRLQFVWLHTQGMYGPWDAPLALRAAMADEDDLAVYSDVSPPDVHFDADADPDARFRHLCAYAAQTRVLDAALGGLFLELERNSSQPWHVLLVGTRGFPLGEHGKVGGVDERLCGEQLHVPLLVRACDGRAALERTGDLVEHADAAATVLSWAIADAATLAHPPIDGLPLQALLSGGATWRDRSIARHGEDQWSIRTSNWCWRGAFEGPLVNEQATGEALFVRPDDRWEANDVASLRSDVAAALRTAVTDFTQCCHQPTGAKLSPLDAVLLERVD